jgi:Tfp pilus assembly protein PilO
LNKDILKKDISLKNILIIVLISMIIGIYIYNVLYPQYQKYISTKENIKSVQNEITTYKQSINNIDNLRAELANVNSQLKAKSSKLSYEMNDGMFLIGLSNNMGKFGVNLVDYTIDEPIKYTTFYAIPTTIKVEGDYRKIREIMYYLEEQKNMTQILDFNMVISEPEEITVLPEEEADPTTDGGAGITIPSIPEIVLKPSENITATFKFIMYSSEQPILELDTSNPNKWNKGKYNPFTPTVD